MRGVNEASSLMFKAYAKCADINGVNSLMYYRFRAAIMCEANM